MHLKLFTIKPTHEHVGLKSLLVNRMCVMWSIYVELAHKVRFVMG